ncbi:Transcription factor, MADS-box [Dillenia turbinata]|uniref:Transcription factor, MADS-box n=1 Tax=Dillenia turbinata TaxID=194707 RepID=A0AAN8VC34_9MAGN
MGKRKIEIKKITDKSKLMVTFSKRRQGLMSKAADLSRLSGAQIALIVTSPANKFFTYGHPSADYVINRFLGAEGNVKEHEDNFVKVETQRKEIEVLERLLEIEKEKERKLRCSYDRYSWVLDAADTTVKGLELDELMNYNNALEELKNSVEKRISEVAQPASFRGLLVRVPPWSSKQSQESFGEIRRRAFAMIGTAHLSMTPYMKLGVSLLQKEALRYQSESKYIEKDVGWIEQLTHCRSID